MARSADVVQAGLVLACGAAAAAAGQVLHRQTAEHWGVERVLGVGLSLAGVVLICAWLLALAAGLTAELLRRSGRPGAARFAARCTPATMRRLAVAVLGVHLIAVPAVAQAATEGTGRPASASASASASVISSAADDAASGTVTPPAAAAPTDSSTEPVPEDLASPYWRAPPVPAAAGQEGDTSPSTSSSPVSPGWEPAPMPPDGGLMVRPETRTTAGTAEVVVAPGDSLWSIVALRLGPFATAADVAEAWPAWYGANRTTIGDDPSLLIPGQVLHEPPH